MRSYHCCPIVRPGEVLGIASIHHRFYGKGLSWVHYTHRLVLRVVRNIRSSVKQIIDAMSSVRANHCTAVLWAVLWNHIPYVAVQLFWLYELNAFKKRQDSSWKVQKQLVETKFHCCRVVWLCPHKVSIQISDIRLPIDHEHQKGRQARRM